MVARLLEAVRMVFRLRVEGPYGLREADPALNNFLEDGVFGRHGARRHAEPPRLMCEYLLQGPTRLAIPAWVALLRCEVLGEDRVRILVRRITTWLQLVGAGEEEPPRHAKKSAQVEPHARRRPLLLLSAPL